ncbi:hypothetical protein EI058_25280 [Escherichia coli]|nr:hypothetical protein [Escherichia coli]
MAVKVAINGFGRIGRCVARIYPNTINIFLYLKVKSNFLSWL